MGILDLALHLALTVLIPFTLNFSSRVRRALSFLLGLALVMLLTLPLGTPSTAIPVSQVPNPRQTSESWVLDMADLLSPTSEAQLNTLITQLEATNGAEMAVVTVPDTQPSSSPKAFATELFNDWGIGKAGIDNGVLFLVSKGDRRTEIETGYAIEAVLPDAQVGDILRTQVTPQFKAGDFDRGILAGTQRIVEILKVETFAPPTLLERYSSWIWEGGLMAIAAGIATLTFKGGSTETLIKPVGRTELRSSRGGSKYLLMGLDWLSGYITIVGKERYPRSYHLAHNADKAILKTWWNGFWATIILWLIFIFALGPAGYSIIGLTGAWLGYEIWQSAQPDPEQTKGQYLRQKLLLMGLGSFIGFILACIAIQILAPILFPPLLTAVYGAFAGALKWRRSHKSAILCKRCVQPMEYLEEQDLRSQLTPVEQTSWSIRSMLYEGWRCEYCRTEQAKQGFDLHLFSQRVLPQKFEYCEDCQGYTVTQERKTLTWPTTSSEGTRLISTRCACCEQENEITETIPRKRSSSSSSSSSYSSSSYSSSSSSSYSSSSSSASSSSDFGGGSSGGGGAGDSW